MLLWMYPLVLVLFVGTYTTVLRDKATQRRSDRAQLDSGAYHSGYVALRRVYDQGGNLTGP